MFKSDQLELFTMPLEKCFWVNFLHSGKNPGDQASAVDIDGAGSELDQADKAGRFFIQL